jgi:hypothetical protein
VLAHCRACLLLHLALLQLPVPTALLSKLLLLLAQA